MAASGAGRFCAGAASRDGRDALLPGPAGAGVCDTAGSAVIINVANTQMDNEGLLSDICPLFVWWDLAATGGCHLTGGQKLLKYRQAYHSAQVAVRLNKENSSKV